MADDFCAPQAIPQFISPSDANAAVARVDADATRLDTAIGQAGIQQRDPGWWAQWWAWYMAWKAYEEENRDWNVFDAPTVYTYCCARNEELREWYRQAAERGAQVGVQPTHAETGGLPPWVLPVGAVVALGVVAVYLSREGRAWRAR